MLPPGWFNSKLEDRGVLCNDSCEEIYIWGKATRAPKSRGYFTVDKFRVSPSSEQAAVIDD